MLSYWADVLALRVLFIDRYVLASMPFFDASPWHNESLFETAQKLTKNAVRTLNLPCGLAAPISKIMSSTGTRKPHIPVLRALAPSLALRPVAEMIFETD